MTPIELMECQPWIFVPLFLALAGNAGAFMKLMEDMMLSYLYPKEMAEWDLENDPFYRTLFERN